MKVILCVLALLCISMKPVDGAPELQFLQIIFAHKRYAPISDLIMSRDTNFPSILTYEYFNTAPLGMPSSGMLNMYNVGVHFRDTYDNFLGDVYQSETVKMHTAEYPLSMISAQLVNAGLWPPPEIEKWSTDMNWQPIPADYVTLQEDTLLLGAHCPSFVLEMEEILNTDRVQQALSRYSSLFNHVSQYTGMKIRQPSEIALLYAVLETKADLNQSLPYWANDIFPHGGMYNVSLMEYDLLWQTPLQKQLIGGTIIKEVLANSLLYIQEHIPKKRKLMMYSGNEINIVGILKGLDLWVPHIPNEGAAVIFEMYFDNVTNSHEMKINYYTGVDGITVPLTIQNCTELCPVTTFLHSVMDLLPQNTEHLCNWEKIDLSHNNVIYSRSVSYKLERIILTLLLVIVLSVS